MKTSAEINELATALAAAQAEMKNAAFNKINPHFKSKYADLASVRDAITPALTKHGLSLVQATVVDGNAFMVQTRILHKSGQWIESDYPIISDVNKPQAMGSAMSYARRYSLSAICGIASEEDDDGNEAQEHGQKTPEVRNIAGTQGASKASARFDYEKLVNEMRKATTLDALKEWLKLRKPDIDKLPQDWIDHVDTAYMNHRESLTAKAA